jgi:hypothetical protein
MTTEARRLLPLIFLGGLACAATPQQPRNAAAGESSFGNRYKVTVVSASIADARPDGKAWHTTDPDPVIPLLTSLASLSMGSVVGQVASAVLRDDDAGKAFPPSPLAKIQIGGTVFETASRRAKFNPVWDYSFAVDRRDFTSDSPVIIVVSDGDGDAPIGHFRLTLKTFLAQPDMNLSGESVRALQIHVDPLPDRSAVKVYRFRVPSAESLESLAERTSNPRFEGDWQPVNVLNGDMIRIRAEGAVQPGTFSSDACGPAGCENGRWASYNRDDFKDVPHAALVAYLAGSARYVGATAEIEVTKAGRLLLGINDKDVGNNNGYFDAVVEVNPPDLAKERSRESKYVPPGWK